MVNFIGAAGISGDLFGEAPVLDRGRPVKPRRAPELTLARALCRQLRQKQARLEKMRIAHLICLNLLSVLRHDAQQT